MAAARNNRLLWIVLALTLAATLWLAMGEQQDTEPLVSPRRSAASLAGIARSPAAGDVAGGVTGHAQLDAQSESWALPRRAQINAVPGSLFSDSPSASVAARQASAAAAAPEMPALPFIYAGKLKQDGHYAVFLLAAERSLAVHEGEVLEGVWRIRSIRPPRMTVRYLPLQQDAVMEIGSAYQDGNISPGERH